MVPGRLHDLVAIAGRSLVARPWRAVGLALPVALGVATVIASFSAAASARADLEASLIHLGADQVVLQPSGQDSHGRAVKLSPEAADRVRKHLEVEAVSALAEQWDRVVRASDVADPLAVVSTTTRVMATDTELPAALGVSVRSGRFLAPIDEARAGDVVVLGARTAQSFGVDGPGRAVLIDDRPYVVVGVLEPAPSHPQVDRAALVPFATAAHRWGDDGGLTEVIVRTSPTAARSAARLLPTLVTYGEGPPPTARTAADVLSARDELDDSWRLSAAASGGLALTLGAGGIAFALWAAVLTRTSEIGIRRALGATQRDVMVQFLIETALIGVAAAVVGGLLGPAATAIIADLNGWPVVVDWILVGGTMLLAVELAVLAGLIPARRAARLEPLDALRA